MTMRVRAHLPRAALSVSVVLRTACSNSAAQPARRTAPSPSPSGVRIITGQDSLNGLQQAARLISFEGLAVSTGMADLNRG